MDNPVKQSGTLDALDQFGITFEGLVPSEAGWALGFRCQTCGEIWIAMRSGPDFQKEATTCPKALTAKKHLGKGPSKKS
jgi:hypothetical protein